MGRIIGKTLLYVKPRREALYVLQPKSSAYNHLDKQDHALYIPSSNKDVLINLRKYGIGSTGLSTRIF